LFPNFVAFEVVTKKANSGEIHEANPEVFAIGCGGSGAEAIFAMLLFKIGN
jgi:cell division GTPase FtsZ